MQGLNSLLPYNARCTSPWKKMRCSLTALQSLSTQPPWVKDCTNSPPATASVPSGKKRGANDPSCHFTGCLTNFRLALLRKSCTLTKVHPLALVSIKFLSLGSVYNHTINKEKFPDHAVQLSPLLLSQWGQKLWDHKHSSGCVMTICQAHASKSAGILLPAEDPAKLIHYSIVPQKLRLVMEHCIQFTCHSRTQHTLLTGFVGCLVDLDL